MCYKSFLEKCATLKGFKKYATAFGLGVLMTFTMPPVGLFPLFLIIVPGLATLAKSSPTRYKTFATGWAFGAGYFIFGLYWVSFAMLVDLANWAWALPFSFILGPTVLALFYGFIPLMARPFSNNTAAHALALAASWSFIEYLRGHILTGFPWILPGYAWDWALPVMQAASVAGVYGLTLMTLCWGAIPLLGNHKTLKHLVILSFVAAVMGGATRLSVHETEQSGDHYVRIVQPNIPLDVKMNQDEDWRNLEKHLNLSSVKTDDSQNIAYVVWPETAVVADLTQKQYDSIAQLISLKLPPNAVGLLGAMRIVEPSPGKMAFYNSLTVVAKKGIVPANYDKHHLVPFGEYMPFRSLLKFTPVSFAADMVGDFVPGPGPRTLHIGSLPSVSPLVCYEAIFPAETVDQKDRADLMVNVTNDGWYGKTAGPHQHFAMTRMRAVEEGLPLARAANTGISGMFDPVGRVLGKLPLDTAGYVDALLPSPLPPTLYARLGDSVFFFMLLLVTGIAVALRPEKS